MHSYKTLRWLGKEWKGHIRGNKERPKGTRVEREELVWIKEGPVQPGEKDRKSHGVK